LQGFFPRSWLKEYCQNGAVLGGHVTYGGVPGVELSTGSLGHGLPYGIGIAIARKRSGFQGRIFVVLSDGECDEGTTWESAMIANHHGLDNLIVIVDRNRLQSLTSTEDTLTLEPFGKKWESFGWTVAEVDGHNHVAIQECLAKSTRPLCIIAETIKGKGVDFMENSVLWHYKFPNQFELSEALSQLSKNH
jgi:transketolase